MECANYAGEEKFAIGTANICRNLRLSLREWSGSAGSVKSIRRVHGSVRPATLDVAINHYNARRTKEFVSIQSQAPVVDYNLI